MNPFVVQDYNPGLKKLLNCAIFFIQDFKTGNTLLKIVLTHIKEIENTINRVVAKLSFRGAHWLYSV